MYRKVVRPLLFALDSETAHEILIQASKCTPSFLLKNFVPSLVGNTEYHSLQCSVMGINFRNPIGLAAGFDKNCEVPELMSLLGFGHLEIGTVTPKPQYGNPKPRIFRLTKDSALVNRMGFPSKGAEEVKLNLTRYLERNQKRPVIGVNIGKQKETPLEKAPEDYMLVAKEFDNLADYFTINISSPNTPGLRALQEPDRLKPIIDSVRSVTKKPIVVKLSPDLDDESLKTIVQFLISQKVNAISATNTTTGVLNIKSEERPEGGLSGKPLLSLSTTVIQKISEIAKGSVPIIGMGGVFNAADVNTLMKAGASLVQIYTALIYEGPFLLSKILKDLNTHTDRSK